MRDLIELNGLEPPFKVVPGQTLALSADSSPLQATPDRAQPVQVATVTQGEIDAQMIEYDAQAGSRSEVERIFLEQGIAPSQIAAIIVLNLQANELGMLLAPNADPQMQGNAVVKAMTVLSDLLDTEVSPRYGTWDASTLQVGPAPDDLSAPQAE